MTKAVPGGPGVDHKSLLVQCFFHRISRDCVTTVVLMHWLWWLSITLRTWEVQGSELLIVHMAHLGWTLPAVNSTWGQQLWQQVSLNLFPSSGKQSGDLSPSAVSMPHAIFLWKPAWPPNWCPLLPAMNVMISCFPWSVLSPLGSAYLSAMGFLPHLPTPTLAGGRV